MSSFRNGFERRGPRRDCTGDPFGTLRLFHPVQRTELVAVGIAQIGEIEFARGTLPETRRLFAGYASTGDAGRVPGVGLFRRTRGKADRAAIRNSGGLARAAGG